MLARVGDTWSLLIVQPLGGSPATIQYAAPPIEVISQKMLSSTLKMLERDGIDERTVLQYPAPGRVRPD